MKDLCSFFLRRYQSQMTEESQKLIAAARSGPRSFHVWGFCPPISCLVFLKVSSMLHRPAKALITSAAVRLKSVVKKKLSLSLPVRSGLVASSTDCCDTLYKTMTELKRHYLMRQIEQRKAEKERYPYVNRASPSVARAWSPWNTWPRWPGYVISSKAATPMPLEKKGDLKKQS